MEEFLVILLQFVFEVLLQALAELPWDAFIGTGSSRSGGSEAYDGLWIVLSLIAGAALGGASLLLFPTTLLHWGGLRMANLVVAPAVSAYISLFFTRRRSAETTPRTNGTTRAVCAACFTFALAIVRFTYAARPHAFA